MKEAEQAELRLFYFIFFYKMHKNLYLHFLQIVTFFTNIDIGSLCEVQRGKKREKDIISSEYDLTQLVFCNAYPWLFPGGVGDLYDIKRGQHCPKEWGRRLLHFHDGPFLNDQMFSLFVFNTI